MYETIKRLFLKGSLSSEQLDKAVQKGWITEEQMEELLALS